MGTSCFGQREGASFQKEDTSSELWGKDSFIGIEL